MNNTKNIMIVGVGGQGSLLASKLLGRLLVNEGVVTDVIENPRGYYVTVEFDE